MNGYIFVHNSGAVLIELTGFCVKHPALSPLEYKQFLFESGEPPVQMVELCVHCFDMPHT